MFFFLTLYMQYVLRYSPVRAALAYLPLTLVVTVSAGAGAQLLSRVILSRVSTRPVIVTGLLIAAGGVYWLSRVPVHGDFVTDLLPGMLVLALGFGAVFVGIATAANAGVPAGMAGLAAALLTTAQEVGGALGIAVLSAISTDTFNTKLAARVPASAALTAGFSRALLVGSITLLVAALVATRITNTRGDTAHAEMTGPALPQTVP
jgi:hypothetical protein